MEVVLAPEEMVVAVFHASVIRGVKAVQASRGNVRNLRVSQMDDFGTHMTGMIGEVAVAKALGVPFRADQTVGGDGMVDLVAYGQRVQVKTSSWSTLPRKRLVIVNSLDEFDADWLVSCAIKWPNTVDIHGFISRRKFERLAFEHDFGYGPKLCVEADALADIALFSEAAAGTAQARA